MYLKSVSMFGFKTFARRTVFEFREGVTAVVGPNGSGKSNLVDAITWALGEQSMRSIRGRKLEEVVYHGSASRKPLGFAEVVLTFDNDDGYFPLPQSEISITRRYFKSGESEFAINNEPCRLKDIQELLIDTGLSTTNYSIINQGDVEYVIDLSPSQRREIFDEAAGINKYKIEKTKTLSKIKDTNINISRLKDILTEISEALGPLKEQAEKAKRYDEIVEEMERLKLGVFASEIRRLKSRLEQLSIEGECRLRNRRGSDGDRLRSSRVGGHRLETGASGGIREAAGSRCGRRRQKSRRRRRRKGRYFKSGENSRKRHQRPSRKSGTEKTKA
jgi:chromosome segregation protein